MNEYIIISLEGQTLSPNNTPVENCQLLGRVRADNRSEVISKLLEENPWILSAGYDMSKCIISQVVNS